MYYNYAKKFNKFGAKKREVNGITYHSGREAQEAEDIELMKKAGVITEWRRQVKLPLDVNGHHITNYFIDFILYYPDGKIELREVKGMVLDTFRNKWSLLEAILVKNSQDRKRIYEAIGYKNPKKHRIEMIIVK